VPTRNTDTPITRGNFYVATVSLLITILVMGAGVVSSSQETKSKLAELISREADHETRIRGVESTSSVVQTALSDIKDRLQRIERKLDGGK